MFSQTLTVKTCGMASTRHTLKAVGSFLYAKLSRYTLGVGVWHSRYTLITGIIPTCETIKVHLHFRCGFHVNMQSEPPCKERTTTPRKFAYTQGSRV